MFHMIIVYIFFQIGFCVAYIVDGGKTVVHRAGRISQGYEGKQLFGYMENFVKRWAKSNGALTKVFTASVTNPNVLKPSFREKNQLIMSKVNNTSVERRKEFDIKVNGKKHYHIIFLPLGRG